MNILGNLMKKVKLNRYRLLLIAICGFMASTQNSGASEIIQTQSATSISIVTASQSSGSDKDSSSDDRTRKPTIVMIAGQYSVSDNFESLGEPPSVGC